jgi:hypothetical protein
MDDVIAEVEGQLGFEMEPSQEGTYAQSPQNDFTLNVEVISDSPPSESQPPVYSISGNGNTRQVGSDQFAKFAVVMDALVPGSGTWAVDVLANVENVGFDIKEVRRFGPVQARVLVIFGKGVPGEIISISLRWCQIRPDECEDP